MVRSSRMNVCRKQGKVLGTLRRKFHCPSVRLMAGPLKTHSRNVVLVEHGNMVLGVCQAQEDAQGIRCASGGTVERRTPQPSEGRTWNTFLDLRAPSSASVRMSVQYTYDQDGYDLQVVGFPWFDEYLTRWRDPAVGADGIQYEEVVSRIVVMALLPELVELSGPCS